MLTASRFRGCTLAFLLALALPAPSRPAAASAAPDEVVLDLVVREGGNRPARNLKPEDLEIIDDGKVVAVRRLLAASSSHSGSVRLLSMVFEPMTVEGARIAREAAELLLRSVKGSDVYVGIFRAGNRLQIVQPYTNDPAAAKRAIQAVTNLGKRGPKPREESAVMAELQQAVQDGAEPGRSLATVALRTVYSSQEFAGQFSGPDSVACLLALVREQAETPGRKTVAHFSERLEIGNSGPDVFESVIGAANQANVSIYPIDISGQLFADKDRVIEGMREMGIVSAGNRRGVLDAQTPDKLNERIETEDMLLSRGYRHTLSVLGSATGGFLISETRNLRGALERIAEDSRSYWQVFYSPGEDVLDGSFRKVEVRAKRAGLKVQARSGYLALPSREMVAPYEAQLLEVLAGAPPANPLPLHTGAVRLRSGAGATRGVLVVEVPLRDIMFAENGPGRPLRMRAAVLATLKDSSGSVVEKLTREIVQDAAREKVPEMRQTSFAYQQAFYAPPGDYVVEAAVIDRTSRRSGVARTRFRILPPIKGPALSQIVLVNRLEPRASGEPALPLFIQDRNVVPRLDPALACSDKCELRAFINLYPDVSAAEPPVLELSLHNADGVVANFAPKQLDRGAKDISYVATVPADELEEGEYELRAVLRQGANRGEEKLTIVVPPKGGALPVAAAPKRTSPTAVVVELPSNIPEAAEQERVLKAATERALRYTDSLPNFYCMQVTRRSYDPRSSGTWRQKDVIVEELRYAGGREQHRHLGGAALRASQEKRGARGIASSGEFGSLLRIIFKPESQAQWKWERWSSESGRRAHVFSFRVGREHSGYVLTHSAGQNARQAVTAFHGEAAVDESTYEVLRIRLTADDIPPAFPLQASRLEVAYGPVRIGATDYLLPLDAVVEVRQGKRYLVRNEIEYRDYRRYLAESTIKYELPE